MVERKQLHLLLDRVMRLHPTYQEMSRREKPEVRRFLKKMYRAMYECGVEKPEPLS
ncbi:hypothetical protein ACFVH6_25630 [Spirillospora sp. NPDC127200]